MSKTRFAPSPTGYMHIGSLRAALLPYLLAKKNKLQYILRIDDTDSSRSKDEFTESIFSDLQWFGIKWDSCFRQSERYDLYKQVLQKCIDANLVYAVSDTEEELDQLRLELNSLKKPPAYKRNHVKLNPNKAQYWRFDIGKGGIKFNDLIKGEINIDLASMSDPVICKPNGEFTYTFTSIVDDMMEDVSTVVRGAEHVANTGTQLKILEGLNSIYSKYTQIQFAHYPLFSDKSGKLSKRTNALAVKNLRNQLHPLSLAHYLTYTGSTLEKHLCTNLDELATHFDLTTYSQTNLIELNESEIYSWQKQIFMHSNYGMVKEFLETGAPSLEREWESIKDTIVTREDILKWINVINAEIAFTTIYDLNFSVTEEECEMPEQLFERIMQLSPSKAYAMKFLRQVLTGQNDGPKILDLMKLLPKNILYFRLTNYNKTKIRLFNTLVKEKVDFVPISDRKITMYGCGPTVYNDPHIGNMRSFIVFDLIYRLLKFFYKNVIYILNITDIDDKIIDEAKRAGISCSTLTERIYANFKVTMDRINNLEPSKEPKVTQHIKSIIDLITIMLDNGSAYRKEDGVYFKIDFLISNDKVYDVFKQIGNIVYDDFVLWKFRNESEIGWDSPWGWGRPGWHIECTAMSLPYLGFPMDIHCGGKDLIFPHHTNECAQACAIGHPKTANYWIHTNFINIDNIKMSKSLGHSITISNISIHPMIIRLALLMSHYRQELNWDNNLITQATTLYNKWRRALGKRSNNNSQFGAASYEFLEALCDDLNTPAAIRKIDDLVQKIDASNTSIILENCSLLGIKFEFDYLCDSKIKELIESRAQARARKEFHISDKIREELSAIYVDIEDSENGTTWYQSVY